MKARLRTALLSTALSVVITSTAWADTVTDDARALLAKGDAGAAYTLLEPLEGQRAGDPEYDLLLGLAALEIGRNTNAVFALERVLAVEPNNVRARAEIARAYAALGETRTAKQEFETVKRQGVPPQVAATIDRMLSTIERVEDEGRTVVRGYVEATIGRDSNVNSATGNSNVAVPLFGGAIFTLNPGGVRHSDTFTTLGAGANLRTPIDKTWALTAGIAGNKRMNNDWDIFDTGSTDAHVGVVGTYGKDVLSVALQHTQFWVDNDRYRRAAGFTAQWQHNYDARSQASLYVQYADLDYQSNQQARDADRYVVGANFAHALQGFKTVFYGGVYGADEDAKQGAFNYLGHKAYGLRGGAEHELRPDARLFAIIGYEHRRYGGQEPFFLRTRDEDQWNFGAGLAWTPAKSWVVTPQYQHIRVDSNIALNDYKRQVVSVTVRREF